MGHEKQKGISGIGTLIIFLALIIVASVAAIVLLETAQSLQSQATSTGKESEKQVSTQLLITNVIGVVKDNQTIEKLRILTKPAPGSAAVYLEHTFLTFSDGSQIRTGIIYDKPYDGTTYLNTVADVNANATDQNEFTVLWFGQPPGYNLRDSIKPDELVEIYYATGDLKANTHIYIEIIPSTGAPTSINFRLPIAFDGNHAELFP